MASPTRQGRGQEWVGGTVRLPAHVTGEGEPYRPETLFWLEGPVIVGTCVAKPGELVTQVSESLTAAMRSPAMGPPRKPGRVRVSTPELAEAVRAGHPELEVICAPVPELDEVESAMRQRMGSAPYSYLGSDTSPAAVASFFDAAARLFRAAPWNVIPDGDEPLHVSAPELGLDDAALSVIGQAGKDHGLLLFQSIDDFDDYLGAAEAAEVDPEEARALLPAHFAVTFERGGDLEPELRREIAEGGWEVAAPAAYPRILPVDIDLVAEPVSAEHLRLAEALCRGLAELLEDPGPLRAAWTGGPPVSLDSKVSTHEGPVELTLSVPFESAGPDRPPRDLLAGFMEVAEGKDVFDPQMMRTELEEELLERFPSSPEAEGLPEIWMTRFVIDFAADYFEANLDTLSAPELEEIVFEIVPRKVSVEPSEAPAIVAEVRALYAFLKREMALPQADACLRVLGRGAAERLESALSDPANFGMAKSLLMGGREAGFDMDSGEGIEAWLRASGAMGPVPVQRPRPAPADRKAKRKKKNQRKAQRRARKKGRR